MKYLKLKDLSVEQSRKLEEAIMLHKRYSSIVFTICKYDGKEVVIQVQQHKSSYENYGTKERLIEIVHETFDEFLPDVKMEIIAVPYEEVKE